MMLRMLLMAGLAASALAVPTNALAICAYPLPRACQLLHARDVVVLGKIIRDERRTPQGQEEQITYTVQVSHTFKGRPLATRKVITENSSGGERFEIGTRILIFGSYEQNGDRRKLWIWCGDAFEVKDEKKAVKEMEALLRPRTLGTLRIQVENNVGPIPGALVTVGRGERKWSKTTDRDGVVAFNLIGGTYTVKAFSPEGKQLNRVSDTAHLVDRTQEPVALARGGCVDLVFHGDAK